MMLTPQLHPLPKYNQSLFLLIGPLKRDFLHIGGNDGIRLTPNVIGQERNWISEKRDWRANCPGNHLLMLHFAVRGYSNSSAIGNYLTLSMTSCIVVLEIIEFCREAPLPVNSRVATSLVSPWGLRFAFEGNLWASVLPENSPAWRKNEIIRNCGNIILYTITVVN